MLGPRTEVSRGTQIHGVRRIEDKTRQNGALSGTDSSYNMKSQQLKAHTRTQPASEWHPECCVRNATSTIIAYIWSNAARSVPFPLSL